jgi:hypothetical protein
VLSVGAAGEDRADLLDPCGLDWRQAFSGERERPAWLSVVDDARRERVAGEVGEVVLG